MDVRISEFSSRASMTTSMWFTIHVLSISAILALSALFFGSSFEDLRDGEAGPILRLRICAPATVGVQPWRRFRFVLSLGFW